jgi:hypothetical protein
MSWLSRLAPGGYSTSIVAVLVAGAFPYEATRLPAQTITVAAPVRISPPGTGNHWFTMIDAAPDDATQLLACGIRSMPRTNSWQGFVYHSEDGGAHWATAMIDSSSGALVSEEACAFGPDGHAYFIAETWNERHEWQRFGNGILRLYRSLDNGRTWAPVIVDPTPGAWMDFARLAVDLTHGPQRGRVYIFGNDRHVARDTAPSSVTSPVYPMRYSLDAGLHFGERVALQMPQSIIGGFPEAARVLPSGTVIAGYNNRYTVSGVAPTPIDTTKPIPLHVPQRNFVEVVRSTDGGRTLEGPITVVPSSGFPGMAVDGSSGPQKGRLYLTWADTVAAVRHVFLTSSDDEGKTWTTPRVVDDSARVSRQSRRSEFGIYGVGSPHVAVNRDGVLGMSWVEDGMCGRFSASLDGGRTFLPSVALNPCPRDANATLDIAEHLQTVPNVVSSIDEVGNPDFMRKGFTIRVESGGGAYGLAADAEGAFHPLWSIAGTDGRLWTARVVLRAAEGPKPASVVALSGLVDVSPRVTFTFTNQDYDAGTGLLTVDMSLVNTDSVPVRGPLRVELTRVQSGLFSRAEAVNADNGQRGAGALWDFSRVLTQGQLNGYSTSGPHELVFRLSGEATHFDPIGKPNIPLLVVEVKILATR